jgi:hypothetical protein
MSSGTKKNRTRRAPLEKSNDHPHGQLLGNPDGPVPNELFVSLSTGKESFFRWYQIGKVKDLRARKQAGRQAVKARKSLNKKQAQQNKKLLKTTAKTQKKQQTHQRPTRPRRRWPRRSANDCHGCVFTEGGSTYTSKPSDGEYKWFKDDVKVNAKLRERKDPDKCPNCWFTDDSKNSFVSTWHPQKQKYEWISIEKGDNTDTDEDDDSTDGDDIEPKDKGANTDSGSDDNESNDDDPADHWT